MPHVIPVKFAYAARDLWFDPRTSEAQEGDHVICSTERGTEIGLATAPPREVSRSELSRIIGSATLKPVLRVADEADLERAERLAERGEEALPTFRRLVAESDLDMKPVGVEYVFGGERVVCYFAAEERVDFRQLVRDLSRELHERIDMRQIGVREEAAVVGGFGHCGQELCCARFGLSFEPVSIRMAKEQDLPLTSNKISGACGRLMCCLRYEFEAYRDFKSRAPKRNAIIDTPLGKAKIVEYDTPKEQLALRLESGKVVRVPLAEMVASEAAVKKSEELGCPCRPDTVVRASLDRLTSPDVQMALAELDRKMGVGPADEEDESEDLFVEARPKRRRRGGANKATQQQETAASASQAGETAEQKRSRRRRRRRQDSAEPTPQQQAAPKHMAKEAPAEGGTQPRRRRRHRSNQATGTGETVSVQSATENEATQTERARRTRRRPGDKGQGQPSTDQLRARKPQEATAPAEGAPDASEATSKRRRRRRRRGGAGRSSQQQAQAAEAES